MRKQIPQSDLIIDIVSRFPEGASVEEILVGLDPIPSRRTLQHRLSSLVKHGLLVAQGKTKGRKFRLPQEKTKISGSIPMSESGVSIQSWITQPVYKRKPVSYHRDFLDGYQPNRTYYLSEQLREKLLQLGKTDGKKPAGTYAKKIYSRLLIDLSWNSSRLEGNTYSLLETERLIELGEAAEGKDLKETQMILNHKAAIAFIIESTSDVCLNKYIILNIHALLSDHLLPNPKDCGKLRLHPVGIGGSVYLPTAVPQVIEECFEQIIGKAKDIIDPFEQAFFLMVHLPYLQPFEDVNKRVSRLAANLPLIRENLCPLSFVDVPEKSYINGLLGIYELNRVELLRDVFVWAYERSCARYSVTLQTLGDPDPLLIRYREIKKEIVALIVRECLDKKQATALIRKQAKHSVAEEDQMRFIESVETELMGLHKGNIARYRLQISEFEQWQKSWR